MIVLTPRVRILGGSASPEANAERQRRHSHAERGNDHSFASTTEPVAVRLAGARDFEDATAGKPDRCRVQTRCTGSPTLP
jgi:hypothetical protein